MDFVRLTSSDISLMRQSNAVYAEAFEELYDSLGEREEVQHFDIPVLTRG